MLAIPASFDAAARELTLAAAREAGLGRVALVEDPAAAMPGSRKAGSRTVPLACSRACLTRMFNDSSPRLQTAPFGFPAETEA
jgi:hypothetical protein